MKTISTRLALGAAAFALIAGSASAQWYSSHDTNYRCVQTSHGLEIGSRSTVHGETYLSAYALDTDEYGSFINKYGQIVATNEADRMQARGKAYADVSIFGTERRIFELSAEIGNYRGTNRPVIEPQYPYGVTPGGSYHIVDLRGYCKLGTYTLFNQSLANGVELTRELGPFEVVRASAVVWVGPIPVTTSVGAGAGVEVGLTLHSSHWIMASPSLRGWIYGSASAMVDLAFAGAGIEATLNLGDTKATYNLQAGHNWVYGTLDLELTPVAMALDLVAWLLDDEWRHNLLEWSAGTIRRTFRLH